MEKFERTPLEGIRREVEQEKKAVELERLVEKINARIEGIRKDLSNVYR